MFWRKQKYALWEYFSIDRYKNKDGAIKRCRTGYFYWRINDETACDKDITFARKATKTEHSFLRITQIRTNVKKRFNHSIVQYRILYWTEMWPQSKEYDEDRRTRLYTKRCLQLTRHDRVENDKIWRRIVSLLQKLWSIERCSVTVR